MNIRWLLAELVVIVLGILIAFQVEEFRDGLREREQEEASLRSILTDIEIGRLEFENYLRETRIGIQGALDFIAFLQSQPAPGKSAIENTPMELSRWLWRPTSSSFDSMRDTGQLSLISSQVLQRALIEYFDTQEPYFLDRRVDYTATLETVNGIYNEYFNSVPNPDFQDSFEFRQELKVSAQDFLGSPELMDELIVFVNRGRSMEEQAIGYIDRLEILEQAILDHLATL